MPASNVALGPIIYISAFKLATSTHVLYLLKFNIYICTYGVYFVKVLLWLLLRVLTKKNYRFDFLEL